MRIISGNYSGRVLSGKIPDGTRPTTDLAREALFNTLQNFLSFEKILVLDLYSGTGAVGIESLSRGADFVTFVENGFKQNQLIKDNLKLLNIEKTNYNLHKRKVLDFLKSSSEEMQYDFIFADPPYKLIEYKEILDYIASKNLLRESGIIVFEMDNAVIPVLHEKYELIKEKKYGITKFIFLKKR